MDLIAIIAIIYFVVKKLKSASGIQTTSLAGNQYQRNDKWKSSSQTKYRVNQRRSSVNDENARWKRAAKENMEKAKKRARKAMDELKRELELEDDNYYEGLKSPEDKTASRQSVAQKQKNSSIEQSFASRKNVNTGSILEHEKANTERNKEDITLHILEAEHHHSERVSPAEHHHPEDIISDNLLGSLEDLMVKGYDGNLCFERDFVGEALDMISHFTVPTEIADFSKNQEDMAQYK